MVAEAVEQVGFSRGIREQSKDTGEKQHSGTRVTERNSPERATRRRAEVANARGRCSGGKTDRRDARRQAWWVRNRGSGTNRAVCRDEPAPVWCQPEDLRRPSSVIFSLGINTQIPVLCLSRSWDFSFFFFLGPRLRHMEDPRLGVEWSCSYWPTPQPQQQSKMHLQPQLTATPHP